MALTTLFDKSFLQSLSVDESVWFDRFYYGIISPIFYVETLADLSKAHKDGRNVEKEVATIAGKTPEMHGAACAHHRSMAMNSLFGYHVPMTGQIPLPRGRPVRSEGRTGVVFEESPESIAFSRWQNGRFFEIERDQAHDWRESIKNTDLSAIAAHLRAQGIDGKSVNTIDDAYRLAQAQIKSMSSPFTGIKMAMNFFGLSGAEKNHLRQLWENQGCRPLVAYAPYAAHVLAVELFFQICVAAGHIASERPSNRVDIAYLYYLPFCQAFVSTDKLHRRCVLPFLRPDQTFVWGADLKADLSRLNAHYSSLDQAVKDQGVIRMTTAPPNDDGFLTRRLWNKHFGENSPAERLERKPSPSSPEVLSQLTRLRTAETIKPEHLDFDPRDTDTVILRRKMRRQKGSWLLVPKDVKGDVEGG